MTDREFFFGALGFVSGALFGLLLMMIVFGVSPFLIIMTLAVGGAFFVWMFASQFPWKRKSDGTRPPPTEAEFTNDLARALAERLKK